MAVSKDFVPLSLGFRCNRVGFTLYSIAALKCNRQVYSLIIQMNLSTGCDIFYCRLIFFCY